MDNDLRKLIGDPWCRIYHGKPELRRKAFKLLGVSYA